MSIKNPDGSSYNLSGDFRQFDPENPEFCLFNDWDQEVIEIGGSPIMYFEVFINMNTVDRLYMEDRGKLWSPNPITLYARYDPVPSQNFMTTFGIDSPDEIIFELNYQDVLRRLSHPPKIGARIFTPHKRENWVIVQRNVESFQLWGEIRLQIMCSRFQESLTTGEGKITQRDPDFKLNDIKDLGKNCPPQAQ
jgi:hypothetical protein